MIVKSLSRSSNGGQLIGYVCRYGLDDEKRTSPVEREHPAINIRKLIIRHNIRSRSLKGIIKEFETNEAFRLMKRKDSVKLFHTIHSFSDLDKEFITDKILKDVTKKYIELRGINNLYIGAAHYDRDHIHLHVCMSGTQLNGRSSRISKQQFEKIKLALDQYQREKYPFLVHSLPEHGKKKNQAKETIIKAVKAERQTNKEALLVCLEKLLASVQSKEELFTNLRELGHEPYFRDGKLKGIKFEGKTKYRFSRLGFDAQQWESLSTRESTQSMKVLSELQKIRSQLNKERDQLAALEPTEQPMPKASNKEEQNILDELSMLRNRNKERDRDKFDEGHIFNFPNDTPETCSEEMPSLDISQSFDALPAQNFIVRNNRQEGR